MPKKQPFSRKQKLSPPEKGRKRKLWIAGQRWKELLEQQRIFQNKWNLTRRKKNQFNFKLLTLSKDEIRVYGTKMLSEALKTFKEFEGDVKKMLLYHSHVWQAYQRAGIKPDPKKWKKLNDELKKKIEFLEWIGEYADDFLKN